MSKTNLNLYCQKSHIPTPGYVTKPEGDLFTSTVTVDGETYSSVEGHTTKKEAEQDAAGVALQSLVQRHVTATTPEELIKSVEAEMSSKHKKTLATQSSAKSSAFAQRPTSTRPTSKQQGVHSAQTPYVVPQQGMRENLQARVSQPIPRVQQQAPRAVPQQPRMLPQHGLRVMSQPSLRESLSAVTAHMLLSPPQELPGVGVAAVGAASQGGGGGGDGFENPHYLPPPTMPPPFPAGPGSHSRGLLAQVQPIHYPVVSGVPPGFAVQQPTPHHLNMPPQSLPSYATPYLPVHPVFSGDLGVAYDSSTGHLCAQEDQLPPSTIPPPWTGTEGCHEEMPLPEATFEPQPPISIPGDRRSPLPGAPPTPEPLSHPPPGHHIAPLNFELELKQYCSACSLPPPTYCTTGIGGQHCRVMVKVGDTEFGGEKDFESVVLARENATLVALASIGLAALKRELEGQWPASVQLQSGGVKELSPKPRSLPSSSSPAQSEVSSASAASSVSSPSQPVESLRIQQLSISGSPAATSAVSAENRPLQPPAFFSSKQFSSSSTYRGGSPVAPQQARSQQGSSQQSREVSASSFTHRGGSAGPLTAHQQARSEQASLSQLKGSMASNHKLTLSTYCQKRGISPPQYDCSYPEDAVGYIATVTVAGKKFTSTAQGTKRGAESKAAGLALQSFGEKVDLGGEGGQNGRSFQGEWMDPHSAIAAHERSVSYKNILQEHVQKSHISELPRYETERTEEGFVSHVIIRVSTDKTRRFQGLPHANKKAAEQECAKKACLELKLVT